MNKLKLMMGIAVILVAAAAFWFGYKSPQGFALRLPASAQTFEVVGYEILNSGDDQLIRQIKLRLLQGMEWNQEGQAWQLKLGAFALKTQGQSQTVCQHYRQVTLRIAAAGVLVAGEAPQLTVSFDCEEQNNELVLPLIDFEDVRLNVQGRNEWDQGKIHYLASLLDEEWFLDWDLREIELVPRHQAPVILIDSVEIHAVRPGAGTLTLDP